MPSLETVVIDIEDEDKVGVVVDNDDDNNGEDELEDKVGTVTSGKSSDDLNGSDTVSHGKIKKTKSKSLSSVSKTRGTSVSPTPTNSNNARKTKNKTPKKEPSKNQLLIASFFAKTPTARASTNTKLDANSSTPLLSTQPKGKVTTKSKPTPPPSVSPIDTKAKKTTSTTISKSKSKSKLKLKPTVDKIEQKDALRDIVVGKILTHHLNDDSPPSLNFKDHTSEHNPFPHGLVVPSIAAMMTMKPRRLDDKLKKMEPLSLKSNHTQESILIPNSTDNDCDCDLQSSAKKVKTQNIITDATVIDDITTDESTKEEEEEEEHVDGVEVASVETDLTEMQVVSDKVGSELNHPLPEASVTLTSPSNESSKSIENDEKIVQVPHDDDDDDNGMPDDLMSENEDSKSKQPEEKKQEKDPALDTPVEQKSNQPKPSETSPERTTSPNKHSQRQTKESVLLVEPNKADESLSTKRCQDIEIETNATKRTRFLKRYSKLLDRAKAGIPEENFELTQPAKIEIEDAAEFPQNLVPHLASLVQGSSLPLSHIAQKTFDQLKEQCDRLTLEAVTEKIKVVFTRENYVTPLSFEGKITNKFEDETQLMWRFEVIVLDPLSDDDVGKVKKARTARRKIRYHSRAITALIKLLDDSNKLLSDPTSDEAKIKDFSEKIDLAEEKVLKFERELERLRVAEEAKRQKEEKKRLEKLQKQKEREEKIKEKEEKSKEKELLEAKRREEKQRMKEEAVKLREEKKREKEAKEAAEKEKAKADAEAKLKKRKAKMMVFFGGTKTKRKKVDKKISTTEFDSEGFWSSVATGNKPNTLFPTLSNRAKSSRKRRTKMAPFSVYVTVAPEDSFNAQQYAEAQTVHLLNKNKFFSFVEDHRPAYYGTWSKASNIITGRNPFGKDTQFLDYDVDSEAEWEEGDEEVGEDLNDETADGEEDNVDPDGEGDTRKYNFNDGWLAEDYEIDFENEEIDHETMSFRKKMKSECDHEENSDIRNLESSLCVISPVPGGLPIQTGSFGSNKQSVNMSKLITGVMAFEEALQLPYIAAEVEILNDDPVLMHHFPPSLTEESFVGDPSQLSGKSQSTQRPKPSQQDMTKEKIKLFAEFIHHSKINTKDSLVEEFRSKNPQAAQSRAQATRKLDAIATKRKDPSGGIIWEVNEQVLRDLGCESQLSMKIVEQTKDTEKKAALKPKSKSKAITSGKSNKGGKKSGKKSSTPKDDKKGEHDVKKQQKTAATEEGTSKKRKDLAASAALLANFLKRKKPKTC